MRPSRVHDRIRGLIKDTPTGKLEEKLEEDEPTVTIAESVGDKVDFQRLVRSPKTGESVKHMIQEELNERRNKMTEFERISSDYQYLSELKDYEPFIKAYDGNDTVHVKTSKAHALNLQTMSEMAYNPDMKVKRVELKKITFEQEE